MPIISDPYTDQRNTLAQSLMKQAVPGFLRQLNAGQARQSMDYQLDSGTGGDMSPAQGQRFQQMMASKYPQGFGDQSGPAPLPPQAQNSGMMPGTVPSAQPQMNPGLSMPPVQPPQQMMPLSQPPSAGNTYSTPGAQIDTYGGGNLSESLKGLGAGVGYAPMGGGTSAGSKGAGAQPPQPIAQMKAGM